MTIPRETLARWGAVLLGVAPAVILPGGIDRYTLPKAAVAALGAALVLTVPATRLPRRISLMIAAAAAVLVGAALLGAAPLAQLLGRAPRYEGVVVGAAYLFVFLAGTRLFAPTRPQLFDAFSTGFALATLAVGGVALIEAAGLRPLGGKRHTRRVPHRQRDRAGGVRGAGAGPPRARGRAAAATPPDRRCGRRRDLHRHVRFAGGAARGHWSRPPSSSS